MPVVWSRQLADELWSGPVSPLTFSILEPLMAEHLVRRRLVGAGYASLAGEPVFRRAAGRVYVNASLIADVMRELPSVVLSEGLLAHLPEELRPQVRRRARSLADPRLLLTLLRIASAESRWLPWSRGAAFEEETTRVRDELRGFVAGNPPPAELIETVRGIGTRLGQFLELTSWGMIHAYVFFHLASELRIRWVPQITMADLLGGLPGVFTFEVHDELLACASAWSADAGGIPTGPSTQVAREAIGADDASGARFRALLAAHGHRLVERDLSRPTWKEEPGFVVDALRAVLTGPDGGHAEERRARGVRARAEAEAAVAYGPGGTLRLVLWRQVFDLCCTFYVARENMRYHADLFLSALRDLVLVAAGRLTRAGTLVARDDIFLLTKDELFAVLADPAVMPDLQVLASRREELAFADPPVRLRGDEVPRRVTEGTRSLSGLVVSAGDVSGRARVIRRAEDLASVEAGDILVATATDPSWISALSVVAGLVLEVGGELSHGAIVARELGIPAIVGVSGVLTIENGDQLKLDGATGRVLRAIA